MEIMTSKKDILLGLFIGLLGALIGTFFALQFFTKQGFIEGFRIMRQAGMIGKVITLGSVPNLVLFFILLLYPRATKTIFTYCPNTHNTSR